MQNTKQRFIDFALQNNVLAFGEFTLKSGRVSPYFFNAGKFQDGLCLARLGQFYAEAIVQQQLKFDTLFGPAYKGIPLVSATAIALASEYDCNKPYSFNRKEAKTHGEGGSIVGAPLQGKVVIVDDVITAGTAIREAKTIIENHHASIAGIVVALDRQERGQSHRSAIQEISEEFAAPVIPIITLNDIIEHIRQQDDPVLLEKITQYRESYGI